MLLGSSWFQLLIAGALGLVLTQTAFLAHETGHRQVLASGLRAWREIFERAIREGQQDGSIDQTLDPAEAAAVVQDTWQGALQRMQVEKSVAALRGAARFLVGYLAARVEK